MIKPLLFSFLFLTLLGANTVIKADSTTLNEYGIKEQLQLGLFSVTEYLTINATGLTGKSNEFKFNTNSVLGAMQNCKIVKLTKETINEEYEECAPILENKCDVLKPINCTKTIIDYNCTIRNRLKTVVTTSNPSLTTLNSNDLVRVTCAITPQKIGKRGIGYEIHTFPCLNNKCNYGATWFNMSFSNYMNCTINTTVNTDLIDFPVRCEMETSALNSNCTDIRAVNSSDSGALDYELEAGTCLTGLNAVVWVKLPVAYKSAESYKNEIHLYYGNNTPVTSLSNGSAVFSNGYEAVFHLGELTGNATNSVGDVSATETLPYARYNSTQCAIGGCMEFRDNSNEYINTGYEYEVGAGDGVTLSARVKNTSADSYFGVFGKKNNFELSDYTHRICTGYSAPSAPINNIYCVTSIGYNSTWNHHATTYQIGSTASFKLIWNGVKYAGTWLYGDGTSTPTSNSNKAYIGLPGGESYMSYHFGVIIDEVRKSTTTRTENWLLAEHAQTWTNASTEEQPSASPTPTPTPTLSATDEDYDYDELPFVFTPLKCSTLKITIPILNWVIDLWTTCENYQ